MTASCRWIVCPASATTAACRRFSSRCSRSRISAMSRSSSSSITPSATGSASAATCKVCGNTIVTDPFHPGDVLCGKCGTYNANTPDFCNKCGDPVGLQLKYDVSECEERGMTYSAPLKVTMRLTIFDKDAETGNRSIR